MDENKILKDKNGIDYPSHWSDVERAAFPDLNIDVFCFTGGSFTFDRKNSSSGINYSQGFELAGKAGFDRKVRLSTLMEYAEKDNWLVWEAGGGYLGDD